MKFKKLDEHTYELDVKGYVCPHPQLYTKKALDKLKPGDVVIVVFDNPSSAESITSLVEREGHKIVEKREDGGTFLYKIQKT